MEKFIAFTADTLKREKEREVLDFAEEIVASELVITALEGQLPYGESFAEDDPLS